MQEHPSQDESLQDCSHQVSLSWVVQEIVLEELSHVGEDNATRVEEENRKNVSAHQVEQVVLETVVGRDYQEAKQVNLGSPLDGYESYLEQDYKV